MKFKQAIKSSIKGGWRKEQWKNWNVTSLGLQTVELSHNTRNTHNESLIVAEILLDPTFWKCLGKNEGWHQGEYNSEKSPIGWVWVMDECIKNIQQGQDTLTAFDNATG